ncbi:MAG: hypothetical protein ABI687_09925, partial [Flavitalea sp.]
MPVAYLFCFALIVVLLIICVYYAYKAAHIIRENTISDLRYTISALSAEISRIELSVRTEIATNRSETQQSLRGYREEQSLAFNRFGELMANSMKDTSRLQQAQLETFAANLNTLTCAIEDR